MQSAKKSTKISKSLFNTLRTKRKPKMKSTHEYRKLITSPERKIKTKRKVNSRKKVKRKKKLLKSPVPKPKKQQTLEKNVAEIPDAVSHWAETLSMF